MILWTLHALQQALNVPVEGVDVAITSVHTDSREVQPGGLFLALPGDQQHGVAFAAQAVANGARVVLTPKPLDLPVAQLVAADTMAAFYQLARAARARMHGTVVAVTGSAGKTTTKEFLLAALQAHGPVASFNNHVGVPLTLLRMPADAAFAVFEIGMNAPGEIAPLAELVQPDVALVTNVKEVHAGAFADLEGIRQEKLSITQGLQEDGTLVVPDELTAGDLWAGRTVTFDPAAPLDFPLIEPTPARVACAQAAATVLAVLNARGAEQLARMGQVGVSAGRGEVTVINGITVIDDSFNANPASVQAALAGLKQRPATRRFAILGDMLELGAGELAAHEALVPQVAGLDGLLCVGPLMQRVAAAAQDVPQCSHVAHATDIDWSAWTRNLQAGDAVLVKGSKKMLYVHGVVDQLKAALQA